MLSLHVSLNFPMANLGRDKVFIATTLKKNHNPFVLPSGCSINGSIFAAALIRGNLIT